jgi:Fe2+ transport system protein FeoA
MPVPNSDLPTRISTPDEAPPRQTLDAAQFGRMVRVTGMPDAARTALEQEGVVMGVVLKVERRVGLGGPVIVRLGRARLAVARAVAATVEVQPVDDEGGQG